MGCPVFIENIRYPVHLSRDLHLGITVSLHQNNGHGIGKVHICVLPKNLNGVIVKHFQYAWDNAGVHNIRDGLACILEAGKTRQTGLYGRWFRVDFKDNLGDDAKGSL